MFSLCAQAPKRAADGTEDLVDGVPPDAVASIGVVRNAPLGREAGGAGHSRHEERVAFAVRAEEDGVLRTVEGDYGRPDSGGDVHRSAIVAQKQD